MVIVLASLAFANIAFADAGINQLLQNEDGTVSVISPRILYQGEELPVAEDYQNNDAQGLCLIKGLGNMLDVEVEVPSADQYLKAVVLSVHGEISFPVTLYGQMEFYKSVRCSKK